MRSTPSIRAWSLLAVGMVCCSRILAAATTTIEGAVRDGHTGDPLPGANVVLVGTGFGASTDLNGKYIVRNVPPGSYTMRATYIGYTSVSVALQVAETSDLLKQDFLLTAVTIEGETIVVTAQAAGQNEAINQQLAAPQIVNIVSSARIRELPDANAAESIGRLPGVSIVRSGGEGTQVVIRGLQPKYNNITVDGVKMGSSIHGERSSDLSMISPYMLDGIEVSKSVTADQDAEVLGGTVNFKMREPGRGREGLGVSLLTLGGYNGLVNAHNKYNNYKLVGSVEGRFLDENAFGVFAQADVERRNLTSNEFGATYTNAGNSRTDYFTTGLNLYHIPRDRRRGNGTLMLDYRLPAGKLGLTNFFSSGITDVRNRGEFYDIVNNLHNYSLAYSSSTLNMLTNILSVEHEMPVFHASARFSHTYSETRAPNDWTARFQQASAGLSQFLNKANLNPLQIPPAATSDPASTYLTSLVSSSSFARERALGGALDLTTDISITPEVTAQVKFGGKFRHQTRSYVYDQYTGQGLGLASARFVDSLIASRFASTLPYVNTTAIPIGPFVDPGFSYGKFLDGDYTMALPLNFAMLSEAADFVKSRIGILAARNDIAYFHDTFNSTTNNYSGTEDQSAFYLMCTLNIGEEVTVIPGVRYQNLRTTYTAARGLQTTASATGGPYNHYDTTLSISHPFWLPDLSVRYKPFPWFDIRLSYSNTLAYPDYNAIIPRIDVTTGTGIAWNNFELSPSRSTNYDAYCSVYDNTIGLFTAGVFLKRITDLIYPWSFYTSDTSALKRYYPPFMGPSPTTGTYNVTTSVNNPSRVDDWGIELDWQTHFWYLPKPLDGLVLNVNYTHVFSEADYPYTDTRRSGRLIYYVDTSYVDRLLLQPNDIVNLSLGYDYEGFSARISLLYQDDVFTGTGYWPQLRTSTSARTRWDLSVKQTLPWFGLQVFGDINNLNSADDISVIHATSRVPQSQQSYGLTAYLGVQCQF